MTNIAISYDLSGYNISVHQDKEAENCYSISEKDCGWLIGLYNSIPAALMGAALDLEQDAVFNELQKEINHFDKHNRLITIEDHAPLAKRYHHGYFITDWRNVE